MLPPPVQSKEGGRGNKGDHIRVVLSPRPAGQISAADKRKRKEGRGYEPDTVTCLQSKADPSLAVKVAWYVTLRSRRTLSNSKV